MKTPDQDLDLQGKKMIENQPSPLPPEVLDPQLVWSLLTKYQPLWCLDSINLTSINAAKITICK